MAELMAVWFLVSLFLISLGLIIVALADPNTK